MKIINILLTLTLLFSNQVFAELDFSSENLSISSMACTSATDAATEAFIEDIKSNGYVELLESSQNNAHVRLYYPSNSDHTLLIGGIYLYKGSTKVVSGSGSTLKSYEYFHFLNKSNIDSGTYKIKAAYVLKSDTSKGCSLTSESFTVVRVSQINSVSVSPTSADSGSTFTWSASISASLPSGYKLQVDFGDGYKTMSKSNNTSYYYSRVASTAGNNRDYTVRLLNSS
ncbi:MAG: hypothetical protein ACI9LM_005619, partial [Alteromonadaceae bacterium]